MSSALNFLHSDWQIIVIRADGLKSRSGHSRRLPEQRMLLAALLWLEAALAEVPCKVCQVVSGVSCNWLPPAFGGRHAISVFHG